MLSKEDWQLVDEVLELTRTANIAGQDFDTVSDGQKQRSDAGKGDLSGTGDPCAGRAHLLSGYQV